MYSKVKRLRNHGARRSDREIGSDPGVVGHVTMATVGTTREMKLHGAGDDSQRKPVIPILFNPAIVTMNGNRLLFSGVERHGAQDDKNVATFLQEWAVEVLVNPDR